MAHSKTPWELLGKKMDTLGLGPTFSAYFFQPKKMSKEDVLTLQEFIALNNTVLVGTDRLVTWKNEVIKEFLKNEVLTIKRRGMIKLKDLLLKYNFTPEHWVVLIPSVEKDSRKFLDFAAAKKDVLLMSNLHKVTDIKSNCMPAKILREIFAHRGEPRLALTVQDMLSITPKELQMMLLPQQSDTKFMIRSFENVQNKFKSYGLTEANGPFMTIPFPFLKTRREYIEELMQEKSFSHAEAILLVDLSYKAGWLQAG